MKNKKLIGSLLVIVMLITMLSATVFADGPGSIEVTNPSTEVSIAGNTYYAYKIFDVTYNNAPTPTAYNYTIDTHFTDFFTSTRISGFPDAYSYVKSLTTTAAITAFAKDVFTYVKANSATIIADGSATVDPGLETCTIHDLALGYYLVNGTATAPVGQTITSLCMLDTTSPTATVHPKLDVPSIDKTVKEDSASSYGNVADYSIGESVPFQIKSKVPSMNGYTSYTFTVNDTMSAGLTFQDDVVVKIGSEVQTKGIDYTVSISGQTFHIVFSNLKSKTAGADIVITYSALLNDKAVIFTNDNTSNNNTNTVSLTYSNNPYMPTTATTPEDTVLVDTYKLDIIKYTGEITSPTYLADAHFSLKTTSDVNANAINFIEETSGVYRIATTTEINAAGSSLTTDLVSITGGTIEIKGIDEGTYYLFETTAPAGYNKLDAAVEVELTRQFGNATGAVVTPYADAYKVVSTAITHSADGKVNVQNNTGVHLPTTGGMGTTIFTVIGVLLMTSVVVVFITRKKLNSRKK